MAVVEMTQPFYQKSLGLVDINFIITNLAYELLIRSLRYAPFPVAIGSTPLKWVLFACERSPQRTLEVIEITTFHDAHLGDTNRVELVFWLRLCRVSYSVCLDFSDKFL